MTDTQTTPVRPVRFGIIGTGRITRRIVADLQSVDAVAVTAIASRTSDRARWYADSYGIPAAVEGYQALLERDDVDAVYVALPPSMHMDWTLAAAQAGKHVLCEKPLAMSADQVGEMIGACRTAGVHWLDATAWLHHDRTTMFRRWLDQAGQPPVESAPRSLDAVPDDSAKETSGNGFELGELRHVSSAVSFLNPFQSDDHRLDPALGGGCLLDLGWYAAGLIRFAVGELPIHVQAEAVTREFSGGRPIPVRVSAMMHFRDDVTATLSCGFDTATRKWCEIAGSNASIVCDDFTRPWPDRPARCWVHEASGKVHAFSAEGNQERQMIERLVGWIQNGSDQTNNLNGLNAPWDSFYVQALQTQQILDAMQTSIETGRRFELECE